MMILRMETGVRHSGCKEGTRVNELVLRLFAIRRGSIGTPRGLRPELVEFPVNRVFT